jgi:hypothetical protein
MSVAVKLAESIPCDGGRCDDLKRNCCTERHRATSHGRPDKGELVILPVTGRFGWGQECHAGL